jgi:hypothetical protein
MGQRCIYVVQLPVATTLYSHLQNNRRRSMDMALFCFFLVVCRVLCTKGV